MAYLLHEIWQRHHMPPDEFLKKPPGVRAFLVASMRLVLEAERKARQEAERG